jgi:hypothetical protein
MRADCGQECIPEAVRTAPYTKGEIELPKTKQLHHLPVVAAAFLAWVSAALAQRRKVQRTPTPTSPPAAGQCEVREAAMSIDPTHTTTISGFDSTHMAT